MGHLPGFRSSGSKVSLYCPRPFLCTLTTQLRLMDKENRKARDDARKEYNDTVRVSSEVEQQPLGVMSSSPWSNSSGNGTHDSKPT
jgi:hypothetical protein